MRLRASTLPPATTGLLFQVTIEALAAFGDGLRCAGGITLRLGQRQVSAGAFEFGFGVSGDPGVHVQGGVLLPGTRVDQVWCRNVAPYGTPAGFYMTNALRLAWSH